MGMTGLEEMKYVSKLLTTGNLYNIYGQGFPTACILLALNAFGKLPKKSCNVLLIPISTPKFMVVCPRVQAAWGGTK